MTANMEKVIRFGVIGTGLMGREFASAAARWCHILDAPARLKIVAAASRRPESLKWFTHNFEGIKQATTNYHEILSNNEVEAVYCAVPHNLHEEIYRDVLAAGKHLLGEKPFGIDKRANARILEVVHAHPELVVRCSSQFPFFPGAQRIFQFLREERFGRILEVECGFLHSSDMDPEKPINWKRVIATNGEYGCMGDLGLHVFHLPLRAGWRPRNVRSILSKVFTERPDSSGRKVPCETWDNASLLCEVGREHYSFPMIAKMQRISPGETNTWYISIKGTQFSARFSTRYPKSLEMMRYRRGEPQCWQEESLGYQSVYRTITGSIFEFGFSDALLQMIAAFCHQVHEGDKVVLPFGCATPEEAQATHEILTAALESHEARRVIEL